MQCAGLRATHLEQFYAVCMGHIQPSEGWDGQEGMCGGVLAWCRLGVTEYMGMLIHALKKGLASWWVYSMLMQT